MIFKYNMLAHLCAVTTIISLSGCSGDESDFFNLPGNDSSSGFNPSIYENLQTGTPYDYRGGERGQISAPPEGYELAYVTSVSRHGSRGITHPGKDLAVYQMIKKAADEDMLTEAGMGLDEKIYDAIAEYNTLSVREGLKSDELMPVYANITKVGAQEHRDLGIRMYERHSDYFDSLAAEGKKILWNYSTVGRSEESGWFWTGALLDHIEGDKPELVDLGADDYMVHFHKFKVDEQNTVGDTPKITEIKAYVEQQEIAYKAYKDSPEVAEANEIAETSSEFIQNQDALLLHLFKPEFVESIGVSPDYTFLSVPPGGSGFLEDEDGPTGNQIDSMDLTSYFPKAQAEYFEYLADFEKFYKTGPGFAGENVTYAMSYYLLYDFITSVDQALEENSDLGAKLRFGHAETVIPFMSLLGIEPYFEQTPRDELYAPTNPWVGSVVSPLATNIQWEIYKPTDAEQGDGPIIRMLHNESSVAFSPSCGTGIDGSSEFYEYSEIRECYLGILGDLFTPSMGLE